MLMVASVVGPAGVMAAVVGRLSVRWLCVDGATGKVLTARALKGARA